MAHLPGEATSRFRYHFVTTFALFIGTLDNPWQVDTEECLHALKDCWTFVYGDILPMFCDKNTDVVVKLVSVFCCH